MNKSIGQATLHSLPLREQQGSYNVVIETVRGSPNKLALDPKQGIFRLRKVLPEGYTFPYDFGFIPSTLAADGDPLDVLVLMDAPTFPGCVIETRLIGVIEAKQKENKGPFQRNDRLLAIAEEAHRYRTVKKLSDLPGPMLDEIEEFFVQYNEAAGKTFKPLGRKGPKAAKKLLDAAARMFRKQGKKKKKA